MPQVTVYVRKSDMEAWEGVVKKSEFIHNALQNLSTYDGAPVVLREEIEKPVHPSIISGEDWAAEKEVEAKQEEVDPYAGLIFDSIAGRVADTVNEEYLDEVTPEMVKELNKRGQVR